MKGSCILVASSVLAASTVAFSSTATTSGGCCSDLPFVNEGLSSSQLGMGGPTAVPISSLSKEKFAPRFDGLRFIETLVTAHRLLLLNVVVEFGHCRHGVDGEQIAPLAKENVPTP